MNWRWWLRFWRTQLTCMLILITRVDNLIFLLAWLGWSFTLTAVINMISIPRLLASIILTDPVPQTHSDERHDKWSSILIKGTPFCGLMMRVVVMPFQSWSNPFLPLVLELLEWILVFIATRRVVLSSSSSSQFFFFLSSQLLLSFEFFFLSHHLFFLSLPLVDRLPIQFNGRIVQLIDKVRYSRVSHPLIGCRREVRLRIVEVCQEVVKPVFVKGRVWSNNHPWVVRSHSNKLACFGRRPSVIFVCITITVGMISWSRDQNHKVVVSVNLGPPDITVLSTVHRIRVVHNPVNHLVSCVKVWDSLCTHGRWGHSW